jgi:Ca2+-dependent lipid-binding protein
MDLQNLQKEFIKGFLIGQAILLVLIVILTKFFLLRSSTETRLELMRKTTVKPTPVLFRETSYDSKPETCEWVNTMVAYYLAKWRNDPVLLERITCLLDQRLNQDLPSFVV